MNTRTTVLPLPHATLRPLHPHLQLLMDQHTRRRKLAGMLEELREMGLDTNAVENLIEASRWETSQLLDNLGGSKSDTPQTQTGWMPTTQLASL